MAQPHILEGKWEEIKLRDEELAGHFLRIIIDPDEMQILSPKVNGHLSLQSDNERLARIKSLRGKYALLGVSVEDLHMERAADSSRDEAFLRGEGK